MAAEVSSNSFVGNSANSDILITKDLLGSLSKAAATKELDLEFKTGKVNSQIINSPNSPLSATRAASSSFSPHGNSIQDSKLQDLNFPPFNFFEDNSLDLKLQSLTTQSHYQSVCTLDKVKFALERAEKETVKKRSSSPPTPSPSSLISAATYCSSPSMPGMFAAACPGCLLYVIASTTNPRCPRCNSIVPPSTMAVKKPRIDLNASF